MHWLIVPLFILATLVLIACLLIVFGIAVPVITKGELLPSIAISCAAVIAALAYLRELSKQRVEAERNTSQILLRQAETGFKEARLTLFTDNYIYQSRARWLRASLAIKNSIQLGQDIHTPELKKAFHSLVQRTCDDFYNNLTMQEPGSNTRTYLPVSFFCGFPTWKTIKDKDVLKRYPPDYLNREREQLSLCTIWEGPTDPKSVITIYSLLESASQNQQPLEKAIYRSKEEFIESDIKGAEGAIKYIKLDLEGNFPENKTP